mmetsp:Transcript_18447/g.55656  ORF Transcript_18447/g.55656 Transcript_18447/m.55656 type:complete len:249 (+) Transcript_18447:1026-1772(+)
MSHVRDVEASGCHICGDENRGAPRAEALQSLLTLRLRAVAVNGGGREATSEQEVLQGICATLGLHEHQSEALDCVDEVQQNLALVVALDKLHVLHDEVCGRTHTTNGQENVIVQEVAGQPLNFLGESGREEQRLALTSAWHVLPLHNSPNLGLETHIQHAIGLVQSEELHAAEGHTGALDEVRKPTGCRHQDVTALLDASELLNNRRTAIDNYGAQAGLVCKLAGLLIDLAGQLAGGRQDQRRRECLA